MKCFHSGTDMGCLQDNSDKYPYYVSLIVNYKGEYDCKIAWIAKQEEEQSTIFSKWGNFVTKKAQQEYLCTVGCEIEFEIDEVFTNRITKLIEAKRVKYVPNFGTNGNYGSYNDYGHTDSYGYEQEFSHNRNTNKPDFDKHSFERGKDLTDVLKEKVVADNQLSMFDKNSISVKSFAAKLILQNFLYEGTLGEAAAKVQAENKNNFGMIDLWIETVDESFIDYYKIVYDKDPSIEDVNKLSKEVCKVLEKYSHFISIDELIDVLKVEIVV